MHPTTNRSVVSTGRFTAPTSEAYPKPQIIPSNPIVLFRLWWSVIALANVEGITANIVILMDGQARYPTYVRNPTGI
jgi:hypothetical protein